MGGLYNLQTFFWFIGEYITSLLTLASGYSFCPPSDAYVRSFLYPLYTLIKLYYTKALSDQASSLAPDWILLLQGPSIPVYSRDSTTTFQCFTLWATREDRLEEGIVAQTVKHLPTMWETWVQSLGQEDPLEKEMATHSSTLAWKIPWMEEPGRLQSMGSQRVGHEWVTSLQFRHKVFSTKELLQGAINNI